MNPIRFWLVYRFGPTHLPCLKIFAEATENRWGDVPAICLEGVKTGNGRLTTRLNGFKIQILQLLRDIEFAIGEPTEKNKRP